jgi:hypothetical protein
MIRATSQGKHGYRSPLPHDDSSARKGLRSAGFLIFLILHGSSFALANDSIGDAAAAIEHDFVSAAKCKSCHGKELMGDQYGTWLKGVHHGAYETLKNSRAETIAREKQLGLPAFEAPQCLVCHVTAFGVPKSRIREPITPQDGVQCESCHGPGRDYRKKKVMSKLRRARSAGLWEPEEDHGICLRCHNSQSPTHDPQRYTLSDGSTSDFDYEQAMQKISHPIPEHVKGHYLELRAEQKAEEKRRKKLGR